MRRPVVLLRLLAVVASSACGSTAASGTSGAGAGGNAGADGAAGWAPGSKEACAKPRPGPQMVSFTTPSGVSFCMDRHEVTMKQYDDFVQAVGKGPIPNHPSEWCQKYNTELLPTPPFGGEGPWCSGHDPVGHPDAAALCIDWCDAAAYCQWAGKRLCGAIGGGETPEAKLDDPMADEWLYVCTNGGKTKYPYGDTSDATKCTGPSDPLADRRESVLAHPECTGPEAPFSEVLNLVGTGPVGSFEYVGAAETTAKDGMPRRWTRGGGGDGGDGAAACRDAGFVRPAGTLSNAGFRCCGD